MATMLAHIKIRDGAEQKWEEIMKFLVDNTLEHESEVVRYEYWKGSEPNHWYGLLSFTSKEAFFVHQDADYHRSPDFDACIEEMKLEFVDPVQTASPLAPTENQPLREDAPDGLKEWENITPVQMADWWLGRQ